MPIPKMKEYVNIVSKDKESEEPPYMVLHSLQRIKKKKWHTDPERSIFHGRPKNELNYCKSQIILNN